MWSDCFGTECRKISFELRLFQLFRCRKTTKSMREKKYISFARKHYTNITRARQRDVSASEWVCWVPLWWNNNGHFIDHFAFKFIYCWLRDRMRIRWTFGGRRRRRWWRAHTPQSMKLSNRMWRTGRCRLSVVLCQYRKSRVTITIANDNNNNRKNTPNV